MGNGEWGMGSGEWGVEMEKHTSSLLPIPHSLFALFASLLFPPARRAIF
jgi:hypothetical protein